MSIESKIEKTPLEGANTSFNALQQEVRSGKITSFLSLTTFSDRFRTQVPEDWAKAGGTLAMFGMNDELIGLAEKMIRILAGDLNENDRMAFGFVLMAAALGRQAPLLRLVKPPPPIQT